MAKVKQRVCAVVWKGVNIILINKADSGNSYLMARNKKYERVS
jgi:hypothetical protein